ncbi:MAG TPA: transposase [Thermoanaerobaculia bacterium]|jgi:putative transposase
MDWHHAPLHRLGDNGAYCVTAATLEKKHFFASRDRMDLLAERFFGFARRYDWRLQAWAFFPNHYHFIAIANHANSLTRLIGDFHSATAREVNRIDGTPGRKVWFQFWETHITNPGSYLARLKYVHENPVHHQIVDRAENYRWCSAGWFARNANSAFGRAVRAMKIDRVKMHDVECGGHAAALI